jgi:hypothetical protein
MQGYRHRPAHQSRGGATPLRRRGVFAPTCPRSSTPRCGSPVPGDHPRKASCERLEPRHYRREPDDVLTRRVDVDIDMDAAARHPCRACGGAGWWRLRDRPAQERRRSSYRLRGLSMTGTDEQTFAVGDAIFVGLYEFYRRSLMLGRAPTGQYPDGLAYDPRRNAIRTTNESARSAGFGPIPKRDPWGSRG